MIFIGTGHIAWNVAASYECLLTECRRFSLANLNFRRELVPWASLPLQARRG